MVSWVSVATTDGGLPASFLMDLLDPCALWGHFAQSLTGTFWVSAKFKFFLSIHLLSVPFCFPHMCYTPCQFNLNLIILTILDAHIYKVIYDLRLSRRLNSIKYLGEKCRVKRLQEEPWWWGQMIPETLVSSSNHLTRVITREDFIAFTKFLVSFNHYIAFIFNFSWM